MKKTIEDIRKDFPLLQKNHKDTPVIYFDNACVSLRPQSVIDAVAGYYTGLSSCAGRSSHRLSDALEHSIMEVRHAIASFIGAKNDNEIIFTRNTTEAINLVAHSYPFTEKDAILITGKEHNSNVLPWQQLKDRKGTTLHVFKTEPDGTFDPAAFENALTGNHITFVAVHHISNLDGTLLPITEIAALCKKHKALLLVDGAQGIPHHAVDIKKLGADFYAFSGHKLCGPSGTGVLWAKYDHLLKMHPFMVGGGTVQSASYSHAQYLMPPARFEAGLQNYSGILGLGAAIEYISGIGYPFIASHEQTLNEHLTKELLSLEMFSVLGPEDPSARNGILTFYSDRVMYHDIALFLDEIGNVAVRSGQFCDHTWFHEQHLKGAVRVSFSFYNTKEEIDHLIATLKKLLALHR
jgi:cysteine desulfurase/selenocysteine lyase